jgi:hypothetical protein
VDGSGNPVTQPDSRVDLFEFDAYFIRGDWTVQGQISMGRQRAASITPAADGSLRDAQWSGLSVLAAHKFTPRCEGIVRADYIKNEKNGGGLLGFTAADDRNGIGPDPAGDPEIGANRSALTLGVNYLWDLNTMLKAELRMDRASQAVFIDVKDGSFKRENQLLGASVVVSF